MNKEKDLKDLLLVYTKHWKWFALSVFIALVLCFIKLRYTTPTYGVTTKIQILEQNSNSSLDLFKDIDFFSGGKSNVLNEIELIKSRSNFIEIVKKLRLNTLIAEVGDIRTSEIFKNTPININFIADDSIINKAEFSFNLYLNSSSSYEVYDINQTQ